MISNIRKFTEMNCMVCDKSLKLHHNYNLIAISCAIYRKHKDEINNLIWCPHYKLCKTKCNFKNVYSINANYKKDFYLRDEHIIRVGKRKFLRVIPIN